MSSADSCTSCIRWPPPSALRLSTPSAAFATRRAIRSQPLTALPQLLNLLGEVGAAHGAHGDQPPQPPNLLHHLGLNHLHTEGGAQDE